jgi:TolB-like protein/DNA-binding winged helix-turn-helix (wHTH) protein/tetratricopeptide (TPR) repeat protein
MPDLRMTPRRLRFGPYEADLNSGELRKHGLKVRLQAQPFLLLALLLERPGELVTRQEVCQALWTADTFVDFDHGLGTAVNKIREALNDSVADPRFIETIPRRGYRFLAPVLLVDSPGPILQAPLAPLPDSEPHKQIQERAPRRRVVGLTTVAALFLSSTLAWYFLRPHTIRSIAVLPLANLSSDPNQQFFAEGVTDELITNLAQISALRVISHTSVMSYEDTHKSSSTIARELGVDAIVEGSIARSGDRVRITTQLIDAVSDRHLWAHTYDLQLSDVLTVQGEVAGEIATNISQTLTPQERARLSKPHPIDPEVALLYFKGSNLLSRLDAVQARDNFLEATRLDPNSAESWAGLADALHTMAVLGPRESFLEAKDAANRALEIDQSQAQALMVLGVISFLNDWNPGESEAFFRRSIAARPSYAMAHALFATTLAHRGNREESLREIATATSLDPVSVLTNSFAWHVYFCARRYDDALRIIRGTIEVDPKFLPAYRRLTLSLEQKGEYQKAIDASLQGWLVAGRSPEVAGQEASALRKAFASGGPRGYWQQVLNGISPEERFGDLVAKCYMHLGRREEALKALEDAYQRKDHFLIYWIRIPEEFDPLRSEPRFQKLLSNLGIA